MNDQFLTGKSILIIDEDQATLDTLQTLLASAGAEAVIVSEAKGAVQAAEQGRFDVIILDREMPGTDGREILKQLKAGRMSGNVPVVMITGEQHSSEVMKSIKLGAAGYVLKPFTPKAFLTQVRKIVMPDFYKVDVPE